MEVITENKASHEALMTVKISPEDYREKVNKILKDYRRKAQIPGFRKGHVPASLIRKQYGKSVLIEEINHILQHAIFDHIQKEEIDILGNPIPVEQTDIDWENQEEFAFDYRLGLAPDFELKLSKKIKVPYFKIVADLKMIDRYVDDYARRFGKMSSPEAVGQYAMIRGEVQEADKKGLPVENGVQTTVTINFESLNDKAAKELTGKKAGDQVLLNFAKAFEKDLKVANLLGLSEEEWKACSDHFQFTISEINKIEPAELNQEFFDKVLGEGAASSEEQFRQKLAEDIQKMFVPQSDSKFYQDVREKLLGKTKFDLPEDFLKTWLQNAGEEPLSPEEAEEKFPEMKEDMRWQLIESKLIKTHNIEVNNEELLDYTRNMVRQQMAQYGQMPEQADLDGIAQSVLQNKDEERRITDQLYHQKLISLFKEELKLDGKEVNYEQFAKKMA